MLHEASESDQALLKEWRWFLGDEPRLLAWSSTGDLFIGDPGGEVALLDPGSGLFQGIAESEAEFRALLASDEGQRVLGLGLIRSYEAEHGPLGPRECLSFAVLPVFGQTYAVENRRRLSIDEHAAVTGEIHRQIRDLPDGSQIDLQILP